MDIYEKYNIERPKTAAEFKKEAEDAVSALPLETKKIFWQAIKDGNNVGQAREIAGIEDVMVAAELTIQCYDVITYNRPKEVDELI